MKLIQLWVAVLILCFCNACSTDVDFGEQYKKQIYIVKGNDRLTETTLPMADRTEAFVTFYCSGSEMSDKDVVVQYKIDKEALTAYNETEYGDNLARQMVCVPEEMVTFEEPAVTIKAGQEYAVLHFSINTSGLDPALNYAVPITITEVSAYEINQNVKTLFYKIKLKTQYSGLYNSQVVYHAFGKVESTKYVQKTAAAIAKNQIKVPVLDQKEVAEGSLDYVIVTMNEDNSVTLSTQNPVIAPQDEIYVNNEPVKVNYYDPDKKQFVIGYSYDTNPSDSWGLGKKYIIETMDYIEE